MKANDPLPPNWNHVPMKDISVGFISGGTPSTKDVHNWDGNIPWTTTSPIGDSDTWLEQAERFISTKGLESSAAHVVPRGSLFVGTRVGVGKAVVNGFDVAINQDLTAIVLDAKLTDSQFIAYQFKSERVQQYFQGRSRGTTIKGVSRFDVERLLLLLPPVTEQRAVVRALQSVRNAIEARQRELALERERKAVLMEHLFLRGTRGENAKQTRIGNIPESWNAESLEKCTSVITKGASPNWQGFDYSNEGIVFVRSQNVGWGRLELTDIAYLPPAFNKKEKKSVLHTSDLLINIVGASIGRAAVATKDVDGGNVNQAVAIVRLKEEKCDPRFVMNFLFTSVGQELLHRQKKDIARANLSLQDLSDFLIPVPSLKEQQEIAAVLNAADRKLACLERESVLLEELFDTLLEELMTGKVGVKGLIDGGSNE